VLLSGFLISAESGRQEGGKGGGERYGISGILGEIVC
jgi:hypothetical protein